MARTQTIVQLDEDLRGQLDARAKEAGVSRSSLIRDAIRAMLAEDRDARIERQMKEFWARSPAEEEAALDEWGRARRRGLNDLD